MTMHLLLKFFLLDLILSSQIHGQKACLEEERLGLLDLKSFAYKFHSNHSDLIFPSWADDPESDCCDWERVTCNSTTGRVIQLSLYNETAHAMNYCYRPSFGNPDKSEPLVWNISLFQPFKELRTLDLSYNEIDGWMQNQGSKGFLRLKQLETLDLTCNKLGNNALQSLRKLTSLKNLILRGNLLEGSFPVQELSVFESLETLDLSQNFINGFPTMPERWSSNISSQAFKELRILNLSNNEIGRWIDSQDSNGSLRIQQLETLDLSKNYLKNSTLQYLRKLTSLKNLILANNLLEGSFPDQELSVCENLDTLDLSQNLLSGSPTKQDIESFSKLRKLRYLTLHGNRFQKDIMRFLGSLPSLRYLDLSDNGMEGSLSSQELANLSNLEVLDLNSNYLNGSLPIKDLITFGRLKVLDFSFNLLVGRIPQNIGKLSSLRGIYLTMNGFNGSFPFTGLCELKKLQELDIRYNKFQGTLPPCLNNLTSLRILDLHDNLFSGSIPRDSIPSPNFLQYMDISGNDFGGSFSFSSIFNHSKLEVVILGSTENKLQIDNENQARNPLFQLKALLLSNCNMKNAPNFLLNQHRLREVDLSHNKLNGMFPSWLLQNNSDLKFLNVRNNSFTGRFDLPLHPMNRMVYIDVSYNHLEGQLPKDLGMKLSNLEFLNFSKNYFEGELPPSTGGMGKLQRLDLSFNNFSGEVPKELAAYCTSLRMLELSNNKFHGEIFSSHFNWIIRLQELKLGNNQFTGSLITNKDFYSALQVFDIRNNMMAGKIPSEMANIEVLFMRNNYFEGQFPCNEHFRSVVIDFSHNFLSGPLPSCFDMCNIQQIHLQGNNFTGSMPNSLLNSTTLSVLNLRDNSLSGEIPALIGAVPALRILLLGNNRLSGLIPRQLCQLIEISILDLSNNSFSGSIPSCLSDISFGTTNNLYYSFNIAAHFTLPEYDMDQADKEDENLLRSHSTYTSLKGIMLSEIVEVVIDFVTKSSLLSYKGDVLSYMSGLDLSCNNLTGKIPQNLGKLFSIRALNLSHNHLIGSIPISFSNLAQLESLDLSYNILNGKIPSELVNLNFLEVFSVAHNNLSGRIPDKGQFATFDSSSYEGNPFLSGLPVEKNRSQIAETPSDDSKEQWYEIDRTFFFASFTATYVVFLLGFGTLLYINPYWRRRWFYLIENFLYSSYYFVVDTLGKLSSNFNN